MTDWIPSSTRISCSNNSCFLVNAAPPQSSVCRDAHQCGINYIVVLQMRQPVCYSPALLNPCTNLNSRERDSAVVVKRPANAILLCVEIISLKHFQSVIFWLNSFVWTGRKNYAYQRSRRQPATNTNQHTKWGEKHGTIWARAPHQHWTAISFAIHSLSPEDRHQHHHQGWMNGVAVLVCGTNQPQTTTRRRRGN